jgi:hypothetical protein
VKSEFLNKKNMTESTFTMDVVVTWNDAAVCLPDADSTVLVCDASGEVHTAFHDGDDGWRDAATADHMTEPVMFWADYPMPPMPQMDD